MAHFGCIFCHTREFFAVQRGGGHGPSGPMVNTPLPLSKAFYLIHFSSFHTHGNHVQDASRTSYFAPPPATCKSSFPPGSNWRQFASTLPYVVGPDLACKRLQIDTDLLLIITSTADELSGGTNVDDLKRP